MLEGERLPNVFVYGGLVLWEPALVVASICVCGEIVGGMDRIVEHDMALGSFMRHGYCSSCLMGW